MNESNNLESWLLNGAPVDEKSMHDLTSQIGRHGLEMAANPIEAIWKLGFVQVQLQRGAHQNLLVSDLPLSVQESENPCSSLQAGILLRDLLEDRDWTTAYEACRILLHLKKELHPIALPICLNRMIQDDRFYPQANFLLGKRGRWLSQFKPEWQWLEHFHSGSLTPETPFHQWWPFFQSRAEDPDSGLQELAIGLLSSSSSTQKQQVLRWLVQNPRSTLLPLIRSLSSSRSKKVRHDVLNLRLHLGDPELLVEVQTFARKWADKVVEEKKGKLVFQRAQSYLAEGLSFKPSGVSVWQDVITNQIQQLIAVVNPESYLPKVREHLDQLLSDPSLEKLLQIILCGASLRSPTLAADILKIYFEQYPEGNTISVQIASAVERLSAKVFNALARLLLSNGDRTFERLALLVHPESPYLTRENSNLIADHIDAAVFGDLAYSEKTCLEQLLPILARKLDSRVYSRLRSTLTSDAIYLSGLTKAFRTFGTILEKRFRLLEALTL